MDTLTRVLAKKMNLFLARYKKIVPNGTRFPEHLVVTIEIIEREPLVYQIVTKKLIQFNFEWFLLLLTADQNLERLYTK